MTTPNPFRKQSSSFENNLNMLPHNIFHIPEVYSNTKTQSQMSNSQHN